MKRIAIITARGGSKRIPRKNIKEFCGKPILCYSIEAALAADAFDEVMVSTDDEEIAEVAKKCGANVPFLRSADTSNDYATTRDVLLEVLQKYQELGQEYDEMCCIYPTAPFVTTEKLKKGIKVLEDNDVDEVCPVVRFSFPPQRCYIMKEGFLSYKYPEFQNARSQDLEPCYHECGQFYMYQVDSFLHKKQEEWRLFPMIMPEMEVQDIDNEEDWKIAEIKYMSMKN